MSKPRPVKPSTPAQIAELKALGYDRAHWVWSHAEAERLLLVWREKAKTGDTAEAMPLLTTWERGDQVLAQGYIVEAMKEDYCYRIERPRPVNNPDGPTSAYHVCLNPRQGIAECDCPDSARRGDLGGCKHGAAVRVWLWLWSQEQEETDSLTDYLEACGVLMLRRAHESRQRKEG